MTEVIRSLIGYEEVKRMALQKLEEARESNESGRIGFVSGVIKSEGPVRAVRNVGMLARYARFVRKQVDFPVFSAIDLLGKSGLMRLAFTDARQFWRDIFQSGGITDVFMTPEWEKSKGAVDEYETARELGIRINQVKWKDRR